jgi:hypothetical protein
MEGPVGPRQSRSDDGVKMGMKPGVIPEGMDHHDLAQYAVIMVQHRSKEKLQALTCLRGHKLWLSGTVASRASVVLEIDAQHDRNAEDELSMRDGL